MQRFEATGLTYLTKVSKRKQTIGDYFLDSNSLVLVYVRLPNLKSVSLIFIAGIILQR